MCYVAAQPKATKQQTAEGRARYGGGVSSTSCPLRDWAQLDQGKRRPPKVLSDAKEVRGYSQRLVTTDSQSER